jgi:hypothetical protein
MIVTDVSARIATIERKPEYRSGGDYFNVSPSLARAKVAREKKPPPAPAAPKPVAVPAIVRPPIPINGRVLARIDDYNGMCRAFRARTDELQITRLELDYLSKLQDGYTAKILGPSQIKSLGKKSLGGILRGTGTYLILVEDAQATAKIMASCKKRERPIRGQLR